MLIIHSLKYLLLILIFSYCRKENAFDCFKSNGKEITEVRYPNAFKYIKVQNKIDVFLCNGSEYKVELIAGEHILKSVSTKITDSVLTIEDWNRCNFVRGYSKANIKIKITLPYLYKIIHDGVGNIVFAENFHQDVIKVRAENSGDIYINGTYEVVETSSHGNGDIYLNGSAKILLIYSNGTNFTNAENFLVSDQIYFSTYSIGDASFNLNGLDRFEYYIWSKGNIYYKGNPKSIKNLGNEDTKGKLIKKD